MIPTAAIGASSCMLYRWRGPEADVVADTIALLVDAGHKGADIHVEYRLAAGCRPDLVVLTDARALIVECKAVKIIASDLIQATRYLLASHARWPERETIVVLAAPDVDDRLVPPPGIVTMRVA